ncbi:MAG: DNA repair protein RadC [Smithellaceae bacterium]|nr:DNA repair protein RadC [Smithellaceae bacterium]
MDPGTPHYLGHRKRLKKRFLSTCSYSSLYEYEIVELLLSYAIPRKDVKALAKELLGRFHSIKGVMDAEIVDLESVNGISNHTAVLIKLAKDLISRYLKEAAEQKDQITCTTELLDYCKAAMGGLHDEQFRVIYLNAQNMIIGIEVIQDGIVSQAVVYPRKVLEAALKRKASAIILVHNHPSGHLRPSDADVKLTKLIQETAKTLDILVHDHLIVGENRYFSFREEGILF